MVYGNQLEKYGGAPRSVIGDVDTTAAGNVTIRVGRENTPTQVTLRDGQLEGWHQTEYVVLTPAEVGDLIVELGEALEGRA